MKHRVLIADDDESARAGVAALLTTWGYEVDEAIDGKEALDRAQTFSPAVVIADLKMPGLDGLTLRAEVREASIAGLALGHLAMPFITFVVAAVFFQVLFGFFRALSGVVAQAALMQIVPRQFMGRTQSAMAILTTILQLFMSFALGWLSQQLGIFAGFALLAVIYALGTLSAFHARSLLREQNS